MEGIEPKSIPDENIEQVAVAAAVAAEVLANPNSSIETMTAVVAAGMKVDSKCSPNHMSHNSARSALVELNGKKTKHRTAVDTDSDEDTLLASLILYLRRKEKLD